MEMNGILYNGPRKTYFLRRMLGLGCACILVYIVSKLFLEFSVL